MSVEERSPKRRRTSYSPASPPLQQEKQFQQHDHALHTPPPSVHMSPSWQTQSLPTDAIPPTPSSGANLGHVKSESEDAKDVEMADADHRRTDHERIPVIYKSDVEPVVQLLPDASQNLIELYSLQALQASVARRDPITGEKINKLRKSYETKSRNLGVEGRNKATVQEGHLQGLVDPAWDAEISGGTTMWEQKMEHVTMNGASTDELLATLGTAFKLRAGRLPRAEYNEWRQQLGLDDLVKVPTKEAQPVVRPLDTKLAPSRVSAPTSPNGTIRPDRAGKKRRYDDSSYEGYEDDGYSTGGADGRSNGVRRVKRKVTGF